jgi:hypothetical protein
MGIASGHCTLILDGQDQTGFTFAMELGRDPGAKTYGFLSGPIELLRAAQSASQQRLQLPSGEILDIDVLQLNPVGLALISIITASDQKAQLQSGNPARLKGLAEELTTLASLRARIEDHLKAEGLFGTTITLEADADADESTSGKWHLKETTGEDNPARVKDALRRIIPELQKRFRL